MPTVEEIISKKPEETFNAGKMLGAKAKPGNVIALFGELGSGKTVIAKGVARGLGIEEDITSPTFTLLEIYEARIPLYHFDLYRIDNPHELDNLFFEEYWESEAVSVIEWAERAADRIPDNAIRIAIEYVDETTRRIRIEYPDN